MSPVTELALSGWAESPAGNPDWQADALCAESVLPTNVWYPDPSDETTLELARSYCAACPVQTECAIYAFAANERFGVWAGLTEATRDRLRRRMRSLKALPPGRLSNNRPGRVCTSCGERLALSRFGDDRRQRDGRRTVCRQCVHNQTRPVEIGA